MWGEIMINNIVAYVICSLEIFFCYYSVFKPKQREKTIKRGILVLFIYCLCGAGAVMSSYNEIGVLATIAIASFIYLLFEEECLQFVSNYVMSCCSLLIFFVAYLFILENIGLKRGMLLNFIEALLFLLQFLVIAFIRKDMPYDIFYLRKGMRLGILSIMIMLIIIEATITKICDKTIIQSREYTELIVLAIGEAIIIGLIYGLIYYVNSEKILVQRNIYMERLADEQRKYFENQLRREEDTRRFRHDIKADLVQIKKLVLDNKLRELQAYVNEMEGNISNFETSSWGLQNDTAEIICSMCLKGYEKYCHIDGIVGNIEALSERDFGLILYNVLQNAVEAVDKMPDEKREINVIFNRGNKYLQLMINNTYINEQMFSEATVKEDKYNHGFGNRNVEEIVNRNHGEIERYIKNGYYYVQIKICM